jgi:nicotinamide riboside kinase
MSGQSDSTTQPVPEWARRAEVSPSGWREGQVAEPRVAVVGPCAAGKSTLVAALRERGYDAQAVGQEHSGVPYLWRLGQPDLLIFLDVDIETTGRRRESVWPADLYETQQARLANAREHAALYLDTSALTAREVAERALAFLAASAMVPEGEG